MDRDIIIPQLILASASPARASLMRGAGIGFRQQSVCIDEVAVKAAMLAESALPREVADALADLKAQRISRKYPAALVIGADQVLVGAGVIYDKPHDLEAARLQLLELRGKPHELLSACVVYHEAKPVWRHIGRAQLSMRKFSEVFLNQYLESHGEELLTTVGAYRIESGGAQLFTRVQGDYFSILGLPMLELLEFLRTRGVCIE